MLDRKNRNNPTRLTRLRRIQWYIVLRHVTFLSSEFQRHVATTTRAGFGLSRPQNTHVYMIMENKLICMIKLLKEPKNDSTEMSSLFSFTQATVSIQTVLLLPFIINNLFITFH